MRIVLDIEANGLVNPTEVWVIAVKDLDSGEFHVFREVTKRASEAQAFRTLLSSATLVVGHNILEYDWPVLCNLLSVHECCDSRNILDTLIISRLCDYSKDGGHSLEEYGRRLGYIKGFDTDEGVLVSEAFPESFFWQYSPDLENYCVRDVEICARVFEYFNSTLSDPAWTNSIRLEHDFQLVVNSLHNNGFYFDSKSAGDLLEHIQGELKVLDEQILTAFPPREITIREFTPKLTKFGTISKSSVPKSLRDQIHLYEAGKTYKQTKMVPFNPSSVKQIITVLNEAGCPRHLERSRPDPTVFSRP